jgi:RNA polymerase sigma-70 factor (ECF subfamily)
MNLNANRWPATDRTPDEQRRFATTHWSVVLTAGENAPALEQLCRGYWYPIFGFLRHQGYSPPDAQDLTNHFSLTC